jgi:hypothetical protein
LPRCRSRSLLALGGLLCGEQVIGCEDRDVAGDGAGAGHGQQRGAVVGSWKLAAVDNEAGEVSRVPVIAARWANSSTRPDFPTRRRPRISTALPGRPVLTPGAHQADQVAELCQLKLPSHEAAWTVSHAPARVTPTQVTQASWSGSAWSAASGTRTTRARAGCSSPREDTRCSAGSCSPAT